MNYKKKKILLFLYLFLVFTFYYHYITPYTDWGGDYGMYLSHAKNIAEGKKYTDIGFIPNPDFIICPEFYPPVFPMLLAPAYRFFGKNIIAFKFVGLIVFLVLLYIIFRFFEEEFNTFTAWIALLFFGFFPYFFLFVTHYILSDIPFLMFSSLFLFYSYKILKNRNFSIKNLIAISVLAYLAYGTRTAGIVLPLAFSGEILLKTLRKKISVSRALRILVLTNALFLGFVLFEKFLIGSETLHRKVLMETSLNTVYFHLFNYYPKTFFIHFFGPPVKLPLVIYFLRLAFLLALSGTALFGFYKRSKEKFGMLELFTIGYFLLLLIWPREQSFRFLFPLLPLFLLYFFYAIKNLNPEHCKIISYAFPGISYFFFGIYYYSFLPRQFEIPKGVFEPDMRKALQFLREEMPDTSVLVADKIRAVNFFINKKGTYLYPPTPEKLQELVEEKNADYILFHKDAFKHAVEVYQNLEPCVREDTARWERVFQEGNVLIYRRKPSRQGTSLRE